MEAMEIEREERYPKPLVGQNVSGQHVVGERVAEGEKCYHQRRTEKNKFVI